MYSDWPSKARLPVMESVIVKGLTRLETECPTLCQLFKSSACVRAINQMSRVSNGIYSSEGTIIVPHRGTNILTCFPRVPSPFGYSWREIGRIYTRDG